jgi:large subunit ribosomal protein L9
LPRGCDEATGQTASASSRSASNPPRERAWRAAEQATKLEKVPTHFRHAWRRWQAFGSVTASDIAHQLEAQGFQIEKRQIDLHEPIRALGVYRVPIRLHADVHPEIKVWVIKQ